jgi:hypothetical protein
MGGRFMTDDMMHLRMEPGEIIYKEDDSMLDVLRMRNLCIVGVSLKC